MLENQVLDRTAVAASGCLRRLDIILKHRLPTSLHVVVRNGAQVPTAAHFSQQALVLRFRPSAQALRADRKNAVEENPGTRWPDQILLNEVLVPRTKRAHGSIAKPDHAPFLRNVRHNVKGRVERIELSFKRVGHSGKIAKQSTSGWS